MPKQYRKIILYIIFTLIGSGLILITCSLIFKLYYAISLSYFISGLASIGLFYFLVYKVMQSTDYMLKKTMRLNFLIRMFVYLILIVGLTLIFNKNIWVLIAVLGGMMIPKLMIFIQYGLNRGKRQ